MCIRDRPTIFLFAGVLALSDAIQKTGAGDVVADWMIKILGGTTNTYLIKMCIRDRPY